ncbi:MAG: DUF1641 domain-containing protein [Bacteroidales bacterium]|nr:DUF1641 domain-containing protein [Bacteroidales bacterium]
MAENNQDLQKQINEINQKLDQVLNHVNEQRLQRESLNDLADDLSIIGKDAFQSTVDELDKRDIEVNVDDLKNLSLRMLRNVDNFNQMLETFESMVDLTKDAGPIVNEVGVDVIHKFHEMEQKGYFDFLRESTRIMDTIVRNYSPEELRELAENIPVILETIHNITQPDMLRALNNAVNTYQETDFSEIKEYSLWKTFKEMRSPEMKKGMGFMITFMKKLSNQQTKSHQSTKQ